MPISLIQSVTAKHQIKTSAYTTAAIVAIPAMAARNHPPWNDWIYHKNVVTRVQPLLSKSEPRNTLSECGVTFERRRVFLSVVHGMRNVQKSHYGLMELAGWRMQTTHLGSYAFSEKKYLRVSV
jgi:hypothetical protein